MSQDHAAKALAAQQTAQDARAQEGGGEEGHSQVQDEQGGYGQEQMFDG
jgi:hypothetical protein